MTDALALDTELGEVAHPDEDAIAHAIAEIMARGVVARSETAPPARRDAHPKAHGCVRAELRVNDDLDPELAHGLFAPGKAYRAWIRFSNGNGDPTRPDGAGDSHGFAMKLLGVPGDKILAAERDAQTHDFLMIDNPRFIIDDPARYLALVRRSTSASVFVRALSVFALGLRGALLARKVSSQKIAHILETRYWSTQAYRLGTSPKRKAIKFSAKPRATATTPYPVASGANFLRERLVATLSDHDVELDFLVQPRTSARMSVERSFEEWPEAAAPFHPVATIWIPKQTFSIPEQDAFGDKLSFTPWHALPAHRPLGAVNRVRRIVYESISTLRHQLNHDPRQEPHDDSAGPA
jgi:hypothetical protein